MNKSPRPRLRYDRLFGLLLIAPWLVGFVLFKLLPILASLGISFTDFYMLAPEETRFIGLANYSRLFHDPVVGYVLFATLGMALFNVPLQIGASILLASVLSSPRLKGKILLRTLFFLPSIIPSVAVLFMWQGFIDPTTGWLNRLILAPLGLTGFDNVYTQGATTLLMAINSLWSIGPGMLIILAALQSLPKEVEESARIDGAGPLLRFFSITLPLISPAVFFSLVINLVAAFGGVILLDRGNVFSGSNSPYDWLITEAMFGDFELGFASSLAWFFFVIVMAVVVVLFTTSRRWVYFPDQER